MKIFKISQDFGGYADESVAEKAQQAAGLLGTTSVDASQVASVFGRTNEALSLVNQFAPNALINIAFVYNFSKGGAFGVYVPAIDMKIKETALRKALESKGYTIAEEGDNLTAYPKNEEKDPEEIKKEIDSAWNQIKSSGGSAIGINTSDILGAAKNNASQIMNSLKSSGREIPPQVEQILNDQLSIYNLAGTIVHEASHARGGDEGAAESDEGAFKNAARGEVNNRYRAELQNNKLEEFFAPLEAGTSVIHAGNKNWYKVSQFLGYKPTGSDLKGRFGEQGKSEGLADWSMLMQKNKTGPIESKLSKEFMFPLEQGVDQENDSTEAQLRKQTRVPEMNISVVMEELLSASHNDSASYMTTEELLEENRPRPLMVPIKKASNMFKSATLFGWYNNLDLDDGSTIPGLSDRVMAWEDRDDSFVQEEDWIEQQGRYNPEYDVKGMYYQWIEPRFAPRLFDDKGSDMSNTHPAMRAASKIDNETIKIVNILTVIQRNISEKIIKSTRIVISKDLIPVVERFFSGKDGIEVKAYDIGQASNGDDIVSAWIYNHEVPEKYIHHAEHYFQNKLESGEKVREIKEIAEEVLGIKENKKRNIKKIIQAAKEICSEYNIKDLYITGSFAREILMKKGLETNEIDFMCTSFDKNVKIGYLIAKRLGVPAKMYENTITLTFAYKGMRVNFEGDIDIDELNDLGKEDQQGFSNALTKDLSNRDFTINMLAYNVANDKVEDPLGVMNDLESNIIKTRFNPNVIIEHNPSVILRALKLKLKYGYEIDPVLQEAMIRNSRLLFDGRYSRGKLVFMRESVRAENSAVADELFEEYALNKIKCL